jgi:peptide deformylase
MLTMKDVIREGHPTLSQIAKEVSLPLSKEDKSLLIALHEYVINSTDETMLETYDFRPSVGIAAPQVNVSKRMYAVHVEDFDGVLYSYMLINPVIREKSNALIYLPGGEGCLSVDRTTEGLTPRFESVTIDAYRYIKELDEVIPVTLHLSGYIAIVFQHELDHLNGILYTQKLFSSLPSAKPAFTLPESEDNDQNI